MVRVALGAPAPSLASTLSTDIAPVLPLLTPRDAAAFRDRRPTDASDVQDGDNHRDLLVGGVPRVEARPMGREVDVGGLACSLAGCRRHDVTPRQRDADDLAGWLIERNTGCGREPAVEDPKPRAGRDPGHS